MTNSNTPSGDISLSVMGDGGYHVRNWMDDDYTMEIVPYHLVGDLTDTEVRDMPVYCLSIDEILRVHRPVITNLSLPADPEHIVRVSVYPDRLLRHSVRKLKRTSEVHSRSDIHLITFLHGERCMYRSLYSEIDDLNDVCERILDSDNDDAHDVLDTPHSLNAISTRADEWKIPFDERAHDDFSLTCEKFGFSQSTLIQVCMWYSILTSENISPEQRTHGEKITSEFERKLNTRITVMGIALNS